MKHILAIFCIFVMMGLVAGCGDGGVKVGAGPEAGKETPDVGKVTPTGDRPSGPSAPAAN